MANIQMVLIVGVMSLILGIIFSMLFVPIGKGQSQELLASSAFSVTGNIADSIDSLAATDYDGTVVYNLPNVECNIEFHDKYVFSNLTHKGRLGEVSSSYVLFTNADFSHPDNMTCGPGKSIVITKIGDQITVEEGP